MSKQSMNKHYERMYAEDIDFDRVKNIKKLAPFKKIKKELIKKYSKGDKVLELGCGFGEYISMFNDSYGCDISFNALKKAKLFFPSDKYFQANAEFLPLKDESFDCILLIDVLEHTENDENIIYELKRILKKGGRVIILTHYSNKYETEVYNKILWDNAIGEGGDLRNYGLELVSRLENRGLKKLTMNFVGGPIIRKLNKIKMKILKKKGYERKDILDGKISEIKSVGLYSKILYYLYKLDYFIFRKKKGKFIFLVMEKE